MRESCETISCKISHLKALQDKIVLILAKPRRDLARPTSTVYGISIPIPAKLPVSKWYTTLFSEMFILVVFGGKKVFWIPESYVGICGSWLVQALNSHVTTCVFSLTEYKKCTQTSGVLTSCATLGATLDY